MFALDCGIHSVVFYDLLVILYLDLGSFLSSTSKGIFLKIVLFCSLQVLTRTLIEYTYSCIYATRDGYHNKTKSGNTQRDTF